MQQDRKVSCCYNTLIFFIRNPFIRNSTQILKKLRNYTHFLEMIRNFEYSGQTLKKLLTAFFSEKLSFRSVNWYNVLHNKHVYQQDNMKLSPKYLNEE